MVSNTCQIELVTSGHGLFEAPIWTPEGLLVADVTTGGVLRVSGDGSAATVIEHRRFIGGIALHESGGLVVSGRNIAVKSTAGKSNTTSHVIKDNDPDNGIVGYNDLTVDSAGRLYVGSMAFNALEVGEGKQPGQLFCIDLDGAARVVADDVLLTNGLAFSPDGTQLYHADTLRHTIYVYDVASDGSLGPKRRFVVTPESEHPDGLAVDTAGNVWVALLKSGSVACFSSDGLRIASIQVGVALATSLCFGGEDLRDLFISGSDGFGSDHGGKVFRTRVETPGLPSHACKVAV